MIERLAENASSIPQEFREIFRNLTLERCTLEKNPVTGELGWRAPKGWAFKTTGQFEFCRNGSNVEGMIRSQESVDLLIAQNQDLYDSLLEKSKGRRKKALKLLVEQLDDYHGEHQIIESFTGKWLVVSPNMDGSPTLRGEPDKTSLKVKADVEAWYDNGFLAYLKDLDVLFEANYIEPKWQQYYALVVPGFSQIELIPFREIKKKLIKPPETDPNKLVFPLQRTTRETYKEVAEYFLQGKITEKELDQEMRRWRELGRPFSDDPLKNFVITPSMPNSDLALPDSARKRPRHIPQLLLPGSGQYTATVEQIAFDPGKAEKDIEF